MPARQADPRANQKARTRAAIVDAALEIQSSGTIPTVAAAAERGGVSRATAYRYFPTQQALLVEIADVSPAVKPLEAALGEISDPDPAARLTRAIEMAANCLLANETDMRRALWLYQDTWLRGERTEDERPTVREGRRIRWLESILGPLDHLTTEQRRRLLSALALTIGMDSLAIMKDVCGLESDEAIEVLTWVGRVLLQAGLESADG